MTLTLSDEAFANSMKQCKSHKLHLEAKEKLIASRMQEQEAITHTVELDGDDQIQIDIDKLYEKGGHR